MRRDLLLGVWWFIGLFGFETATSVWELRKALGRVGHDPQATGIVKREVALYALQMASAYLAMGLFAGLVLFALGRALPGRRGWLLRAIFAAGVTAWIYLRGAILWPMMHLGAPGLDWWAGHVNPNHVTVLFLAAGAAGVAIRARREGFDRRWLAALVAFLAVAALADSGLPARKPHKNTGPNVIIVGFDALRPDHLASFGYERDTAPALDRFLADATVFERAFTPLARTWAAWNSILTGTGPVTHGKRWSLPVPGEERPDVPLLTDALGEAGYWTGFLTDDSRFSYMVPSQGWDLIDQPWVGIRSFATSRYQPNFRVFFTFLNGPLGWLMAPVYRYNQAFSITHRHDLFAERIADAIGEGSEHDRFFLSVHSCVLHAPADRSWPYHTLYGMSDYRGGNRYRYRSTGSQMADGDTYDGDELSRLEQTGRAQNANLYDAGIAMVDETWARISQALDEGDLWDNTLVIVLSDHGEDFLEPSTRYQFRGPNHGYTVWGAGQYRVLMAVKGMGFQAARREDLVSLIDVAPTIATALGITLETAEGVALQSEAPPRVLFGETGVSESNYWSRGHRTAPFAKPYLRYGLDPGTTRVFQNSKYDLNTIMSKDRLALDDRYWLVEENLLPNPRYSLFDWCADPTFAKDLTAEEPEAFSRLYAALRAQPRVLRSQLPALQATAVGDDGPTQDDAP